MNQLKLWKFSEDYGRYGEVEGLFIATKEDIDKFLVGKDINFGEILGKHSNVSISFEKKDFKCLDVSDSTVNELFIALGSRIISGHNPFSHVYDYLKCTNCGFGGSFADCWWDSNLLTANTYCPECGSENYKMEEEE